MTVLLHLYRLSKGALRLALWGAVIVVGFRLLVEMSRYVVVSGFYVMFALLS